MAGAVQRLPVADLHATVIAPAISPLPTVVALLAHVLRGGLPELRGDVLAQLRRRDVAALLPLRTSERGDGGGGRPNEIVPTGPAASLSEQLDAVAEIDPAALVAAIAAADRAGHAASPWQPVAADPARWLRHYVQAVRRAWTALEPLWRRSAGSLDREVERVSVALARGAGAELVADRFPYCRIVGSELVLPSHADAGGPVRTGAALVLHPLVAPAAAAGWTDDYGDVCLAIRYAVPGAWRRFDDGGPPPASLAALVGPQRALILTRLEHPRTAGELAALLQGVPSIASHHVRALERAGLVTRVREGRSVSVRRTARGTDLVALYSERP